MARINSPRKRKPVDTYEELDPPSNRKLAPARESSSTVVTAWPVVAFGPFFTQTNVVYLPTGCVARRCSEGVALEAERGGQQAAKARAGNRGQAQVPTPLQRKTGGRSKQSCLAPRSSKSISSREVRSRALLPEGGRKAFEVVSEANP